MVARAHSTAVSIAEGYAAPDAYDELLGADGVIGAHWQPFLAGLDGLTHEQRRGRIERINTRVRETGIAHDVFADPATLLQPWRLDLVPLILPADTWATIERGVIQRARLLEALLADIYGAQSLMQRGLVPPRLVYSDPAFLRACKGIEPKSGRIQFLAVDIARRADGAWQVIDTHLETPAGIGYALANRMVLTHVCGDLFSASRAVRLAPYFQQMQDALARRINRADPTIALLTPGPRHGDFFSHAYLARYLGFLVVEGDDLRVDRDRVYLKTLEGLQPIDLVVRCVDGALSDALELDPSGFLGPVGLVQAARRQPDLIVNALGTAIAENRGLGGYLPTVCRELLGEDLALADVEKYWLGDPALRSQVTADLDHYLIRQAFEGTGRPGQAEPASDPARLDAGAKARLLETLAFDGASYVAERKSVLATAPSYGPRGLEARPYAMRVFATAGPDGFIVMPGGLAMTVAGGSAMALASPEGLSRDVWVLSDRAQPVFKSLWRPAIETAQIQRSPRELPSRTADNLFWLGRYSERADWTFRVLRSCLSRLEEDSGPRQHLGPMRTILVDLLHRDEADEAIPPIGLDEGHRVAWLARALMTATDRSYGLPQTLNQVHRVASLTRDRLSSEAWRTLNAFYVAGRWLPGRVPASIGEQLDLIDEGLGVTAAFNGLTHENMTRNFGWSFLDMGRRLSRALNLSLFLLAAFAKPDRDEDGESARMQFVLELADSFITYRSRYRLNPMLPLVLDLLIVDETNPRSIAFQAALLAGHIDALPQTGKGRSRTEVQKLALALLNDLKLADVEQLAGADDAGERTALVELLNGARERLSQLSDALTRRYFSVVEDEPRWIRARSMRE